MQLCKKLEVGMLLLALFYLFSPLVSVSKTCFFQGVKAGDMIFILVFCLLFVWSWRFAKKESLVFKLSGIDVLLLVCGLYIIVLYLFSWEQLDREVLLMHVACGLLYIAVRILGIQQMRLVFWIFLFLLLWQLWYGIACQTQYFYPGRGMRLVHGSFLNTGMWSCFVACVGIILCGEMTLVSSRVAKMFCGLGVFLIVYLLFMGNSRAAWLGFAVGGGYLFYKETDSLRRLKKWGILLLFSGVLLGAGMGTWHKVNSALGRLLIWKISGQMCYEHPWGTGLNGFQHNYMAYQENYFVGGGNEVERMLADETLYAFNDFLRIGVEQGIFGLLFIVVLLYLVFRRNKMGGCCTKEIHVIRGVLLAWLVFSLFSYPSSQLQTKAICIVFIGMLSSSLPGMLEINGKWLGVLTGIVGILFCCQAVWPYREAVRNWENCLANRHVLAEEVDVRYRPLMNSSFFLANCSLLLNQSGEHVKALEVADRGVCLYHSYGCCVEKGIAMENLGCYDAAEVVWILAGNLIPNRFRPLYLRMEMKYKLGDMKQVEDLIDSLSCKKIKVRSPELLFMLERVKLIEQEIKTKCQ